MIEMKKCKILVSWKVGEEFKRILLNELKNCEIEFARSLNERDLCKAIKDKHILIAGICTERMIKNAEKLELIHSMIKSVNRINLNLAKERGIKVTNTVGYCGDSVAEFIIGIMIMLSRDLSFFLNRKINKQKWSLNFKGFELKGKTLGIIGLGEIGCALAKRAKCMGMKIYGIDIVPSLRLKLDFVGGKESLNYVLKNSDFISINLHRTPETINFMTLKHFKIMKKTAFYIDTSRGGITNFEDLYKALKRGYIKGAFLDVFPKEPPDYSHPVFKLKNFYFSPHIAGVTKEAEIKSAEYTAGIIKRFLQRKRINSII